MTDQTASGSGCVGARAVGGGASLAPWRRTEPTKPADPPKLTAGAEGFVLQSSNGDYRLQLRGYVQFDGRFFPSDDGRLATDNFLLRRVRPIFAGTVGRHFEFQIMPDFGVGTTVLQDAWLDVNYSPKARVRVGKFKSPVGLERLQSATAIAFVERAYPTALVPNRDVGRDAPRRPRGRGRGVRGRRLRRGSRRRQRRPGPQRRQGRGRAASSSRPSSGAARPSRTWASGSPAPPGSRPARCRPIARAARSAC